MSTYTRRRSTARRCTSRSRVGRGGEQMIPYLKDSLSFQRLSGCIWPGRGVGVFSCVRRTPLWSVRYAGSCIVCTQHPRPAPIYRLFPTTPVGLPRRLLINPSFPHRSAPREPGLFSYCRFSHMLYSRLGFSCGFSGNMWHGGLADLLLPRPFLFDFTYF